MAAANVVAVGRVDEVVLGAPHDSVGAFTR